jgi:hypothetical protein
MTVEQQPYLDRYLTTVERDLQPGTRLHGCTIHAILDLVRMSFFKFQAIELNMPSNLDEWVGPPNPRTLPDTTTILFIFNCENRHWFAGLADLKLRRFTAYNSLLDLVTGTLSRFVQKLVAKFPSGHGVEEWTKAGRRLDEGWLDAS